MNRQLETLHLATTGHNTAIMKRYSPKLDNETLLNGTTINTHDGTGHYRPTHEHIEVVTA